MTIPANAPRRYTTSRQLIAGDDFNNLSDHVYGFQSLVAVGPAAQATAPTLNASNIEILAASPAGAVKLPIAYPGQDLSIINNSAQTITIFPQANGDVIQSGATGYGAANASVTMLTAVNANFFCIKKGFWQITKTTGP
jgi:hypothetical protein